MLFVADASDFNSEGGAAEVSANDVTETVTYSAVSLDDATLTLSVALVNAFSEGADIKVLPRARVRWAHVLLDDADDDVVMARVRQSLRRDLIPGIREDDEQEAVLLRHDEGRWVVVDVLGSEAEAIEPQVFTWSLTGDVSVGTRVHRFQVPFGGTIEEVKMTMGTGGAPAGSSIIVDILKGGSSILGSTKVIVPDGELDSDNIEPTTKEVTKGNIIQIEFEQVGSTTAGSNPTLYMTMFPAEGAIAGRVEVPGPPGTTGTAGTNGTNGVLSEIQDEGVALTDAATLDFVGAGVTATSDGTKYTVTIPSGSLARTIYTASNLSTTSTSYVDAEATNLAVTFTAPSSGNVNVRLEGQIRNGGGSVAWNLRTGAGDVAGTGAFIIGSFGSSIPQRIAYSVPLTGLTAGVSYTYKWGWKVDTGTAQLVTSTDNGPATMEVWAVV